MILGDAGYGVLLLIGAVILTVKSHKLSDATLLLWVLSIATIIWGALTGTWFGLESAMQVPLLRAVTIPALANYPAYFAVAATDQQNAIMKFCFILGTLQLSLACVMSIKRKLTEQNLSWIADLGWLIAHLRHLLPGPVPGHRRERPAGSRGRLCGRGLRAGGALRGMAPNKSFSQGLKAGLADAFTVFLNTISALATS